MNEVYVLVELQINGGEVAIVPPTSFTDKNLAEQAFHTAAATAAVSSVEKHSVVLLNQDAFPIERIDFEHAE